MAGARAGLSATIWHNPRCSKSREALARLQAAGADVTIYDYRADPPSRARLEAVIARAGLGPRDLLRSKEPGAAGLKDSPDAALLDALVADPTLIERPIVETDKGAVLARPADRMDAIL